MSAGTFLRADLARFYHYEGCASSRWGRLKTILGTEAIWSIVLYRWGQYLLNEAPRVVGLALRVPYALAHRVLRLITGIHLYPATRIGPGLYIGHYGGVWISPLAEIGSNCNLSQGVTIGVAGSGERKAPVLEDEVWVGPTATISGPVRVGRGAVVAANSLVAADVPPGAVVIGVPARVMSHSGSRSLLDLPRAVND